MDFYPYNLTGPEFLEFFSSMIAMDDPRHARLRRIVSAGLVPLIAGRNVSNSYSVMPTA